jgi:hypothetical protein
MVSQISELRAKLEESETALAEAKASLAKALFVQQDVFSRRFPQRHKSCGSTWELEKCIVRLDKRCCGTRDGS